MEFIKKFCKSGDASILDSLDAKCKQKVIDTSVRVLFQSPENIDTSLAFKVLQHFNVIETLLKVGSKNIIGYTGNINTDDPIQKLLYIGVTTVPVYSESQLDKLVKDFDKTLISFPEYNRHPNDPTKNIENDDLLYVLGGFAALGNPASFHNPFVRKLRTKACQVVRNKIFKPLLKSYPDQAFAKKLRSQVLFDRMMYRQILQEPVAEAWHRDIIDKKVGDVKPGDIIFGGWVNTSKYNQAFSFIPGSHLGVNLYKLKSGGFAEPGMMYDKKIDKLKKELKSDPENDEIKEKLNSVKRQRKEMYTIFKNHKQQMIVPPGHCIIFPQYILHEVVAKGVKHIVKRVFTGYRLTSSNNLLMVDPNSRKPTLLQDVSEQRIMLLGGGMKPPVYSANHGSNFLRKPFNIYGAKNPKYGKKGKNIRKNLIQWSNMTFKDICEIDRPARNGKDAYRVAKRHMNSLEELGLPKYKEYSKKELKMYYPQKVL